MPLDPKFADLALKVGIDEDTDAASDPEGFLALENCEYTKEGVVRGRHGFTRDVNLPGGMKVRGLIQAGGSLGVVATDQIIAVSPTSGDVEPGEPTGAGYTNSLFLGSTGQNVVSTDSHRKVIDDTDYTLVAMVVQDQLDPNGVVANPGPNTKPHTTVASYQIRESLTGAVVREGQLSADSSDYNLRVVDWMTGWIVFVIDEIEPVSFTAKLKAFYIPGPSGNITQELVASNVVLNWETALKIVGCPYDAVSRIDPPTQVSPPRTAEVYLVMWVDDGNGPEQRAFIYRPGQPILSAASAVPRVPLKTEQTCTQAVCLASYSTGAWVIGVMYRENVGSPDTTTLIAYKLGVGPSFTGQTVVLDLVVDSNEFANGGPTVATLIQHEYNKPITLLLSADMQNTVAVQATLLGGTAFTGLESRFWPGVHPTTKLAVRTSFVDGNKTSAFCGIRNVTTHETQYRNMYLARVLDRNGLILDHPMPISTLLFADETWPDVNFYSDSGVPVAPYGDYMPGEVILPSLVPFGDGLTVTLPSILEFTMDGNRFLRRYRTVEIALDPETRRPVVYAQIAGSAVLAGSLPVTWDGTSASQAAFLYGPPIPRMILQTDAPVNELPPGKYLYIQVFEHIDHNGRLIRSPPSQPQTVVLGGIFHSMEFTPKLPEPTMDSQGATGYRLKLYRTAVGGVSSYNLVLDMAIYPGQIYEPWTDTVPDNERGADLYTQGLAGMELSADPVPAMDFVAVHRNRVFGVRSDSTQIRYTKEVVETDRPEWNDELLINVENDAGNATALASLSDLLVVFQEHAVCIVDGPGPDPTGVPLGSFTVPQKTVTGYGVAKLDSASVVTTPIGVLFKHASGIKLLTKPTEVVDIGDPVRDLVALMGNLAGTYMPGRRQVWFYGSTIDGVNRILVLDIDRMRWMVWTPNLAGVYPIRGATELDGVAYIVTDAAVWKLDEAEWSDRWIGDRHAYTQVMDIPWFRGAGQAGMARVWDIAISGYRPAAVGNPTIKVEVFVHQAHRNYAHSPVFPETSPSTEVPVATYTFPANRLPQGPGYFMLAFRPRVQRCIGMRLRITIKSDDDSLNAGAGDLYSEPPRISNIRYHFGVVQNQGRAPYFPTIT